MFPSIRQYFFNYQSTLFSQNYENTCPVIVDPTTCIECITISNESRTWTSIQWELDIYGVVESLLV